MSGGAGFILHCGVLSNASLGCLLPILNSDTEILLLEACLCSMQSVCHSGNLCCGSSQGTSQREISHAAGSSWAAQAPRTAHLLGTVGVPQQQDGGTCCLGGQSNCPGKERSPEVAMFHWLTCLSDAAETEASEDGGLEVGLLTLLSGW